MGEMTLHNPNSFVDLATTETDFGRPKQWFLASQSVKRTALLSAPSSSG